MKFLAGLAALALSCVDGQVPIPSKPLGFTVGNGSADASIQLEVFFDLLCPDSKAAYPGLEKLVANLTSSQFRLRIHQFPLPYHHQAFPFAQASHTITHALGKDKFTKWLEAVYDVQDTFWNKPTEELGQKQVTEQIEKLAKRTFPQLTDAQWKDGMTGHGGTQRDVDTRTEWKHACSRGISGTPQYLLNDVPISADSTWTAEDWLNFLQPFLNQKKDAVTLNVKSSAQTQSPTVSTSPDSNPWEVVGYVGAGAVLGVGVVLATQRLDRGYERLQ